MKQEVISKVSLRKANNYTSVLSWILNKKHTDKTELEVRYL